MNAAVSVHASVVYIATNTEQITVYVTFFMQTSYNFILELQTKSPKMIG